MDGFKIIDNQRLMIHEITPHLLAGPMNTARLATACGHRQAYQTHFRDRLFRLKCLGVVDFHEGPRNSRVWRLVGDPWLAWHILGPYDYERLPAEWRASIESDPADWTVWLVLADQLDDGVRLGLGFCERFSDEVNADRCRTLAAMIRERVGALQEFQGRRGAGSCVATTSA